MTKEKYKATPAFDVDAFDNYEGLGNGNHARLAKGRTVELEVEPIELIKLKMIKKVGGK
tara:strand:+ start:315 stop:491 length:177 start_codon:yes stop_codon:yes gene_type:complete